MLNKLILFIICLLPLNANAAITVLSHSCVGSTNSTTVTSAAINTTGASLIVISLSYFQGGSFTTPTDSSSNTWTQLTVHTNNSDTSQVLFYVTNPTTSASHTFTENNGGTSTYPGICVTAFSGTQTSSPFDVQNGNQGTTVTTLSTGSITPGSNNELVVTGVGGNYSTSSINSGYTIIDSEPGVASHGYTAAIAYIVQTTATATNPTWTQSGSGTIATTIASFKAASGGGAGLTVSTINNATIKNATIN